MTHRQQLAVLILQQTDDCILSPGKPQKKSGYTRVQSADHQRKYAHVQACEWAHGPKPTALHEVAHSCRNRVCVNPRHLRWATRQENADDRMRHGAPGPGNRAVGERRNPEARRARERRADRDRPDDEIAREVDVLLCKPAYSSWGARTCPEYPSHFM